MCFVSLCLNFTVDKIKETLTDFTGFASVMCAFRCSRSTSTCPCFPPFPSPSSARWTWAIPQDWATLILVGLIDYWSRWNKREPFLSGSREVFSRVVQGDASFCRSSLTPGMGQCILRQQPEFPSHPETCLPVFLLPQPQGFRWVSYAPLHVRLNLITRDKVLQSRPLKDAI